ncbi:ATP-dependent DNA helicase Q4 isoform X3 [Corvus moneduloides]|uniref:ATP-dependent DNA helicase Q4 isoform X3 n=1 Tax=Corvus moneduloides TaxID=1196302 RepID=UPI0013629CC0|nr:ATP-dependent DNA helicase Q4 isoform X3 [Corvus moneduloides]
MERQQELKVLLKRWEAEFLRERRRKPSQADIEEAPEETRKLYKEYRMLKQQGKASDSSEKTGSQEIPNVEQVEDSGFWGSHLNRAPKIPGKSRSGSARPGISAEFYGMKLKAKLGMTGKEPPLTPRRTPNPRRIPKIPQSQKNPEREAEASSPEPPRNEGESEKSGDAGKSGDPEKSGEFSGLGPLTLPAGMNPGFPPVPDKFQRLKQSVAQTLRSLDPGWLQRCQESPENQEFPAGSVREKGEIHTASIGNSVRKRPREGGGAAEAPAKLQRGPQGSDPGIFGVRSIQEENEGEEEQLESRKEAGKAADRLEKILEEEEKEEKPKPTRRGRATPRNGGNFVRLNLKRKTYSRGCLRGKFLRKQVWKQKWRKKSGQFGGGADVCFRCGRKGHWASECRGKDSGSFPVEIPEEEEEEPLPTLEEVARRTNSVFIPEIPAGGARGDNPQPTPNSLDFPWPEFSPSPPPAAVDPLYSPAPDGTIPDPPEEVLEALRNLGYDSFRPGQAEAVMRILSGLSTLVVLPTGMGKSLCYQLPAFLYHKNSGSVSLVISPLVSLMDDQVSGLPPCLKAVCIHSNLSQSQREAAMEKVRNGQAQILLLSPEALVASGSSSLFFRDRLPPVAFACLDEAHCISQWSHNFRPAYLRVCKVLRQRLGVRCFLGLTATATAATARDVAQHLGIPPEQGGGVRSAAVPANLLLSVSMDADREQALLSLLRADPFGSCHPLIVFCTRREDTERLAALLRSQFPQFPPHPKPLGKNPGKGKTAGIPGFCSATAYHAGLSGPERRRIQRDFMGGRIRVLVATVAFGMGLDKADVRGIVHYNIPGNLESYVQEVGRAGRDGSAARCHLFLEPQGRDLPELRRHIYGDSVDFWAIRKLLQRVFAPCKCLEIHGKLRDPPEDLEPESSGILEFREREKRRLCRGHERCVPVAELVQALDLREEGENSGMRPGIRESPPGPGIPGAVPAFPSRSDRDPPVLPGAASRQLPAAASCHRFPLPHPLLRRRPAAPGAGAELPSRGRGPGSGALGRGRLPGIRRRLPERFHGLGISAGQAQPEAAPVGFPKRYREEREFPGEFGGGIRQQIQLGMPTGRKSGIAVEFLEFSFHFRAYGDLSGRELDSVGEFLHGRVVSREKAALRQLRCCFRAFRSVAFQSCHPKAPEKEQLERSSRLKELLREYFERDGAGSDGDDDEEEEEEEKNLGMTRPKDWEEQVRADIRNFLATHPDEKFSGRAIARIFHGIGSPRFPAQIYGRDRRFWRRHLPLEFQSLSRLATEEILAWR